MSGIKTFSAVNTKVRAMRAKLLKNSDYIALMSMKTVNQIVRYLKEKTVYKEVLSETSRYEDIRNLEIDLMSYTHRELKRLFGYFSGNYREFLEAFRLHYDIRIIKNLIRRLVNDGVEAYRIELENKGKYLSKVNLGEMMDVRTYGDFVEKLNISSITEVLDEIQVQSDIDFLFHLEMSIDRFYFYNLRSKALELDKENREVVLSSLGENIDLLNLEWIYRGTVFYKLNPEELINYTMDYGKEFTFEDIKELCYLDVDNFIKKISKTKYKFIVKSENDIELYMKRRIDRYLFFNFFKKITNANFNIDTVLTYIHLLDFEYKDILAIVEATRYDLKYTEKMTYLVRKIEGSE